MRKPRTFARNHLGYLGYLAWFEGYVARFEVLGTPFLDLDPSASLDRRPEHAWRRVLELERHDGRRAQRMPRAVHGGLNHIGERSVAGGLPTREDVSCDTGAPLWRRCAMRLTVIILMAGSLSSLRCLLLRDQAKSGGWTPGRRGVSCP